MKLVALLALRGNDTFLGIFIYWSEQCSKKKFPISSLEKLYAASPLTGPIPSPAPYPTVHLGSQPTVFHQTTQTLWNRTHAGDTNHQVQLDRGVPNKKMISPSNVQQNFLQWCYCFPSVLLNMVPTRGMGLLRAWNRIYFIWMNLKLPRVASGYWMGGQHRCYPWEFLQHVVYWLSSN